MKKLIDIEEYQKTLEDLTQRRIAARRLLCEAALRAGSQVADQVVNGKTIWWNELAPLTRAERAFVWRAIAAGVAAGSSSNVD